MERADLGAARERVSYGTELLERAWFEEMRESLDSPSSSRSSGESKSSTELLERIDRAWSIVSEQFTQLIELEQTGSTVSQISVPTRKGNSNAAPLARTPQPAPSSRPASPRSERAWSELLDEVTSWEVEPVATGKTSLRVTSRRSTATDPNQVPEVSVIIPSIGRKLKVDDSIRSSLEALPSCEIITVLADGRPYDFSQGWTTSQDNVHELRLWKKQGWGAAIRIGLMQAIGEYVIIQSPHRPLTSASIDALLEPLRQSWADVTILSQFSRDGLPLAEKGAWRDRVSEAIVGWAMEQLYDLPLTHAMGSSKAIRGSMLQDLAIRSRGEGTMIDLLVGLHERRARFQEVPDRVPLKDRTTQAFMTRAIFWASIKTLLRKRVWN